MAKDHASPTDAGGGGAPGGDLDDVAGLAAVATGDDPDDEPDRTAPPTRPQRLNIDFPVVRRGYERDAVDETLARALARIDELELTVAAQQERLVEAANRPMLHELDEDDLVVIASEETTQMVRSAQARATAIRDAAANEAEKLREATKVECDELIAAANKTLGDSRTHAASVVDDAEKRARQLVDNAEKRAATLVGDAEERARQLIQDAEQRAHNLVNDADRDAATTTSDAEKRARAIIGDAERQARSTTGEANKKAAAIVNRAEERYEEIRATIKVHRKRLREELDSQREELQQIDDSLRALRGEFSTSFQQVTETMERVRDLTGMLWRFGEPVQRAEGYVQRVFEQLGDASLPPRKSADDAGEAGDGAPTAPPGDETAG